MVKIRYIPEIQRYFVLFADGGKGWCSERAMRELFPDRNWDIVREHPNQWFYL